MRKFFKDFKAFISRGNIIDMAVGVIIGTAFSAIVTALTNQIIMPIINWILSLDGTGLESAYTFLKVAYIEPGVVESGIDLANSIYINWGAFITAILNFLIIALTLFIILKVAMKSSALLREAKNKALGTLTKEDKAELKKRGISRTDKEAVKVYLAEKDAKIAQENAKAEETKKLAEEEAKKNSTEYLLKEIRDLLAENKALKEKTTKKQTTKTRN